MEISRKEMKTLAKQRLLGNYRWFAGVTALCGVGVYVVFFFFMMVTGISTAAAEMELYVMVGVMLVSFVLMFCLWVLYMAGFCRACYRVMNGETIGFSDFFYGFSHVPFRFLGAGILCGLVILFASLPGALMMLWFGDRFSMFLILGIYVINLLLQNWIYLRFGSAFLVLAANPQLGIGECMQVSGRLVKGQWFWYLKLMLSFLGLFLLVYMTFGIGLLWLMPYMTAVFYAFLIERDRVLSAEM